MTNPSKTLQQQIGKDGEHVMLSLLLTDITYKEVFVPKNNNPHWDLKAETIDGDIHLIQCKATEKDGNTIDFHEAINKLRIAGKALQEKENVYVSKKVIFVSEKMREKQTKDAENAIDEGEIFVWHEKGFTPEEREKAKEWRKKHPVIEPNRIYKVDGIYHKIEKKTPREGIQRMAVNAGIQWFNDGHERGQIILPCGTGKTLTSFFINTSLNAKVTIFFCPSLALIKQTRAVWLQQEICTILSVCSEKDRFHTEGAGELFIDTCSEEIKRAIEHAKSLNKKIVIFSTYQSSERSVSAIHIANLRVNMAIYDEAHRGGKQMDIASSLQADKKLFMTATRSKNMEKDKNGTYGELIYRASFREAIKEGAIKDYHVVFPVIYLEDQSQMNVSESATQISSFIDRYKSEGEYNLKSMIIFANRNDRAKQLSEYLNDECTCVDSKYYHEAGIRPLDHLRKKSDNINVLTNCKALTEGVDVPCLSSILFFDARKSHLDIIQAIGRVLRKKDKQDNQPGLIFFPVYLAAKKDIDHDDELSKKLEKITEDNLGDFEGMINVCAALRVEDEEFFFESKCKILNHGIGKEKIFGSTSMYKSINTVAIANIDKVLTIQSEILADRLSFLWNKKFEELQTWAKENNALPRQGIKTQPERSLGGWAVTQRMAKKGGKLSQERIKRLETVSHWFWERDLDAIWDQKFQEVQTWAKKNNSLPSRYTKTQPERSLGQWIGDQRKARKGGKLSQERIKKLETVSHWFWEQDLDVIWDKTFQELQTWAKEKDALPKEGGKTQPERSLGKWAAHQREAKKKGKLSQERIRKLETVSHWFWEQDLDAIWDQKFRELQIWAKANNALPSQHAKTQPERSLGRWAVNQRTAKKGGKLSQERIRKLETVSHWFWEQDLDAIWDQTLQEVQAWAKENNALPKKGAKTQPEKSLGIWITVQRGAKKEGKLSQERIKRLETVSHWFWDLDAIWDQKFQEVRTWAKKNNALPNSNVKIQPERSLGQWAVTQRMAKKGGKLSQERIKRLETVSHWFWEKDLDAIWDKTFQELQTWAKENNALPNANVKIQPERSLGQWIGDQRKAKKGGKLSQERIKKLETVSHWFWEQDLDAIWDQTLQEVQAWAKENNALPRQGAKIQPEKSLGQWAAHQREAKKKGKLFQERIRKLETVSYWFWKQDLDAIWDQKFQELQIWIKENNSLPKEEAGTQPEKSLGIWATNQRAAKKKYKLSQERIKRLETVSHWFWERDLDAIWDQIFQELQIWANKNDTLPKTGVKTQPEKSLGLWSVNQRKAKKKGKLSQERIKRLETVSHWFWERDLDAIWDQKFQEVQTWAKKNNSLPSRYTKTQPERSLGIWASDQRMAKKRGKLSQERIKKLETVSHWFWDLDAIWDQKFQEIQTWAKENNVLPSQHAETQTERSLGLWATTQRAAKKGGKLSQERIKRLETVSHWFWNK